MASSASYCGLPGPRCRVRFAGFPCAEYIRHGIELLRAHTTHAYGARCTRCTRLTPMRRGSAHRYQLAPMCWLCLVTQVTMQ